MAPINLSTPIFDDAIHGISFFNGRLLSGEDMAAEQTANREGRKLIGKALGDGIAYGLQVAKAANAKDTEPFVTVQPGLAINREGRALLLAKPVDLTLTQLTTASIPIFNSFTTCDTGQTFTTTSTTSTFAPISTDVYVLVISPADVGVGRAPVSGLGNIDASCNSRYNVEGVLFKFIPLGVQKADLTPPLKLRNRIANRCIQTPDAGVNPFGKTSALQPQGLIDQLRQNNVLADCDVPLAAVYMESANRLRFIDLWSVRRSISRPLQGDSWSLLLNDRSGDSWSPLLGERPVTEGQARFLQFQAQIVDLCGPVPQEVFANVVPVPNQIAAGDRFETLPPVGIIPISGTNSVGGVNWKTFFGSLAPDSLDTTDSDMLPGLLRESFTHKPIQVGDTSSGKLRLYLIRENVDAVNQGKAPQLALVFAKQTVPYAGVARFGYAHYGANHFV